VSDPAKLVLVTGGTGMVGSCIIQSLLSRGHRVRALVRSPDKGRALLPAACTLVQGDVTAPETLPAAVADCAWVFHAAGFQRFIFTSTIDVFRWRPGQTYDESELDPSPKATSYERSKQRADQLVADAVSSGLDAVFLHPSAVYGPAPSDSPGVNDLLLKLSHDKVPALLPGGFPVVFAPDVGEAHVLAASHAAPGARYILSERYYPLTDLAREMLSALGLTRKVPRVIPLWLARTISTLGELKAKLTSSPPLMPKGQLSFLQVDSYPSAQRATTDLGLSFTSLSAGLAQTVAWLRSTGKLPTPAAPTS
jgi:nucleoside-diphosphate-sugar epimerase